MKKEFIRISNILMLTKFKHIPRIMKLATFFGALCISSVFAAGINSQTMRVNIQANQEQMKEVIRQIEEQTDYLFVYNKKVNLETAVSIQTEDVTVAEALNQLFSGTGIVYAMEGSNILLMDRSSENLQNKGKTITGVVVDAAGIPVVGANIKVKGTPHGTITDLDGKFVLEVEKDAILGVSYIGYNSQEIKIGRQSTLHIELEEDTQALDEVVVVGYGVQKKSDVTGAIGSVNTNDMKKTTATNVEQMLQGRVPGVSITSTSGAPGSSSSVRIRGVGTLNNASPLYVVDGIPMGSSNVDYMSSEDIESIEILKDASSAAIYGSRAANGVILITTKKGTKGKTKVVFNGSFGKDVRAHNIEMLGAADYIDYLEESFSNDGGSLVNNLPAMLVAKEGLGNGTISPKGTDWWKAVKNDHSITQNYSLGISGASDKVNYNLSSSYYKQTGLIKHSDYERATFKLKTIYTLWKGVDLGLNIDFYTIKTTSVSEKSGANNSVYASSLVYDPTVPYYDKDGIPSNSRYDLMNNPLSMFVPTENDWSKKNKFSIHPSLKWTIIPDLVLNTNFNYSQRSPRSFDINPEYYHSSRAMNSKATIAEIFQTSREIYFDAVVNYMKTFNKIHNLSAMLGMSVETSFSERMYAQKSGLPDDGSNSDYWSMDNAEAMERIEAQPNGFSPLDTHRASYFGRLNYSLDSKYLLQFSLRADGSGNLGPSHRWGVFPSFSAAWRLNQERFLKEIGWLDNLKIRGGYGVLGNDDIGVYKYTTTIDNTYICYPFGSNSFGSRDNLQNGIQISSSGNKDLKWESTTQFNLALDFGVLNNTLSGSIDLYKRNTDDILISLPVSIISGLTSMPVVNGAGMENKGFEINLKYQNRISDFSYSIAVNMAVNKNEVTSLGYGKQPIYSNSSDKRTVFSKTDVGYPIAYFWGFKTDGIFQNENEVNSHVGSDNQLIQPNAQPGDIRYVDINNDGTISEDDKTYLGDPTPNLTYGLNIALGYKNWDLSMFFNGAAGFELINLTTTVMNRHEFDNITKDIYEKRWHGEGTSNQVPRLTFNDLNGNLINNSDRYVEKGDYLRLSNLQVGYTFDNPMTFIRSIRLSLTGQNLFTLTGFSGQDPAVGKTVGGGNLDLGMSYISYPTARSYMFGVNVVF